MVTEAWGNTEITLKLLQLQQPNVRNHQERKKIMGGRGEGKKQHIYIINK